MIAQLRDAGCHHSEESGGSVVQTAAALFRPHVSHNDRHSNHPSKAEITVQVPSFNLEITRTSLDVGYPCLRLFEKGLAVENLRDYKQHE